MTTCAVDSSGRALACSAACANYPVACSADFAGCSFCYCTGAGAAMDVACTSTDACAACAAIPAAGCSGGTSTCTSDGECYACTQYADDGQCAVDPTPTACPGGLLMSCPGGATGCSESFRTGPARRVYAPMDSRRQRFTAAPHPGVPAHGQLQHPAGIQERADFAERAAYAERSAWNLAAPSDGSYSYNADCAATPDGDMLQYHCGGTAFGAMDYKQYTEDIVLGQETRVNHQRWVNNVFPWSAGRARKVDTLEDENYVNWIGFRGPHQSVEVANPSQVTELDPEDLARWGRRVRIGQAGGEGGSGECIYNWKG